MPKIAILYGTTEGQTAKIAQHIGARARSQGHEVDVLHVAELPDEFTLSAYDGAIVGASIHEGHHQRYVERFLKRHAEELARVPAAGFSVCLAIESRFEHERAEASRFPQLLQDRTGVQFGETAVFAGALKYTEYSWLKRVVMKQIAKHEGAATDTAHDHEYTDWNQVDRFADALFARVQERKGR